MSDQTPPTGYGVPPAYGAPPVHGGPHYPSPPPATTSFPVWAIVLIALAVLTIPAGMVAAIAIPMFLDQHDKANDSAVKEGVHAIQVGIQTWAVENGDRYPDASDVSETGDVGALMRSGGMAWPENPFTGAPMQQGTAEGDFDYELGPDGLSFTLVGHLSGGETFVLRGGIPTSY